MSPALRWPGAILAGAMLPLACAPFDCHPLAIVSLGVLFFLWQHASLKVAFGIGYVYGLLSFGLGVGWLYISIHQFGNVPLFVSLLLTVLLVAFLALYPALAGVLAKLLWSRRAPVNQLLILPACWVLVEYSRSRGAAGFPWLNTGASQIDSPLSGFLPVLGVYGVSLLVALSAGACTLLLLNRARGTALTVLLVVWLAASLGQGIDWTRPQAGTVRVALAQGSVPQGDKWDPERYIPTIERYVTLSLPVPEHDLLIWPETAITRPWHQAREDLERIRAHFGPEQTFLVGLLYRNPRRQTHNSILIMEGATHQLYRKRHLVPFGEYVPLRQLIETLFAPYRVPIGDLHPGSNETPYFTSRHGTLGLSICYEVAFGRLVRTALPEAGLLVNVANDAWFGNSPVAHQHLQIARVRARETSRYLLRGTNTGISAIIDERGKVQARSPQFVPYLLQGEARVHSGSTPFVLWGYWPTLAWCLLVAVVALIRRLSGTGVRGRARRQAMQDSHRDKPQQHQAPHRPDGARALRQVMGTKRPQQPQ